LDNDRDDNHHIGRNMRTHAPPVTPPFKVNNWWPLAAPQCSQKRS
jgi:hypothetical protein